MSVLDRLQLGDVFITIDPKGAWQGAYYFMGIDGKPEGRVLGRCVDDESKVFSIRPDAVQIPFVAEQNQPDETPTKVQRGKITAAQRRMIFGVGKSLGFDTDDLRDLTPHGSISKLSAHEANLLIDRLKGIPHHGDRGTASKKQFAFIEHLRGTLGFNQRDFGKWLLNKFKVASLAEVSDGGLASKIIGGMMNMQQNKYQHRRVSGA